MVLLLDLESLVSFTKMQYSDGAKNVEKISPDSWNMDQYFLDRTGNAEI